MKGANKRNLIISSVVILLAAIAIYFYLKRKNNKVVVVPLTVTTPLSESKKELFRYAFTCPATGNFINDLTRIAGKLYKVPEGTTRFEILSCLKRYIPLLIKELGLSGEVCKVLSQGKNAAVNFVNDNVEQIVDKILDTAKLGILAPVVKPLIFNVVDDIVTKFIIDNHTKLAGPQGFSCPVDIEPVAPEDEWA